MNTRTHSIIGTFVGITAAALAIVGGTSGATGAASKGASTATVRPVGDCKRVAPADYRLCNSVRHQHAYGHLGTDATWSNPNGVALIKELTHDGLTDSEMHYGLVGTARDYAANVTAVRVSVDSLRNADCRWVVSLVDQDHKPGGTKLTMITQDCP
jgi:hypothetical protein